MASGSILVRVPATVGNFAGAMNCAALALDAALNVKVTPRLDGHVAIRYFGENGERVPRDRSNLIVRAMEAALHLKQLEFAGADFEIYSSVPVAVGLGSSSASVLAGLIAADRLFRLELEEKTFFELAAIYESRAENLRAAWFGGFVACAEGSPAFACRRTVVPENFVVSVVVPDAPLAVDNKPEAAADRPAKQDQSGSFQRAARLAEFFARPGDGSAPELDAPLPPPCLKDVPGLEEALGVRTEGLLAAFVCGSGPAVGILTQNDPAGAVRAVRECFARHGVRSSAAEFRPTNAGAREWNAAQPDVTLPPTRGLSATLRKSTLIPV